MRFVPLRIRRRGIEMRLVVDDTAAPTRVDRPLLKTAARAYRWADDLLSGRAQSVGEIARRQGVSDRYVWLSLPRTHAGVFLRCDHGADGAGRGSPASSGIGTTGLGVGDPVHTSATSHAPAEGRHTVPAGMNVQFELQHEPLAPLAAPSSHCSPESRAPLPQGSSISNAPAAVPAYSVLGVVGSMASPWTVRAMPLRPVLIALQLPPLLVLWKTPPAVPAYSVLGVVGSMASAWTRRNKTWTLSAAMTRKVGVPDELGGSGAEV